MLILMNTIISRVTVMFYGMRGLLMCMVLLMLVPTVRAESPVRVAAVSGLDLVPYEDALAGFSEACGWQVKRFFFEEGGEAVTLQKIRESNPDLILAVGRSALIRSKAFTEIPVVYVMISNPVPLVKGESNVVGVSMDMPGNELLSAFLAAYPHVQRLGIVYSSQTQHLYDDAQYAVKNAGKKLTSFKASSEAGALQSLKGLIPDVDAFWMLPDTMIWTGLNINYLFSLTQDAGIPVLAFSPKYSELGEVFAPSLDARLMGANACALGLDILSAKGTSTVLSPRR